MPAPIKANLEKLRQADYLPAWAASSNEKVHKGGHPQQTGQGHK